MKVQSLKITSFRGIDDLTLEFNPNAPTVFIGINGVGKSSILDCLSILLLDFVELLLLPPESDSQKKTLQKIKADRAKHSFAEETDPCDEDIKKGCQKSFCEIAIVSNNSQSVKWSFSKRRETKAEVDRQELEPFVKKLEEKLESSSFNLPVLVYYHTNRAVLDIPLSIPDEYKFEQLDVYDDGLIELDVGFNNFFHWFRNLEDLENEERRDNSEYRDKQLEAVRQAIYSLMPNFTNLRVRRSPLRMTVNKNGEELIVNQLSDGEKCLLAMVGDLARRLAIANPLLDDPLQGEGVVLIDEIELHLHPQWQREIIPALTRTFPNCQFIVTTHSPQVVSHVQPDNIYILEATADGIIANRPSSSYGRDSNRILEDLMNTPARPQKIKDEILELFRIIDRGDLDAAKQLRQHIIKKIGTDEPELVKADVFMRRKEILKR
jgi:predicted ATP-binding protein involved in virulence